MSLDALSPLDGRYADRIVGLAQVVSERALIAQRLYIEGAWLAHLLDLPCFRAKLNPGDPAIIAEFNAALTAPSTMTKLAERVKELEATTNHDVKAVEYALREGLGARGASTALQALIHFACTSEDINNLAYALMLNRARRELVLPALDAVIYELAQQARAYGAQPMLARTHGQPATPTTLGKELAVFGYRLQLQRDVLAASPLAGKMNGAVGNYNAHVVCYPELNWQQISRAFVSDRLGLTWNPLTTQIENHDTIAVFCDNVRRIDAIGIDLCRDIWAYISLRYFIQESKKDEVGSSTMPHKINPIDFENAEGNFGLASALAGHFAEKLPVSRLQRDLSDSTVLRSLGSMLGYHVLALQSLLRGLRKIKANPAALAADLENAWEVLAEPVQTLLRANGVVDAYERLKALTRGKASDRATLATFVESCSELSRIDQARLLGLTPQAYTGLASQLAEEFAASILDK